MLEKSTDVFPPLKSAVGGLLDCLDIVKDAATNREDYEELTTELTTMTITLNQYMAELDSEGSGSSLARLVLSIEAEILHLRKKQGRVLGTRFIESTQDSEDVIKQYRRIETLFRQLHNDVSLRAWKTTDKQFKMSLLERMAPADDALYNSGYSTTIKRHGCTAETRERIQADLHDWVRDPDAAKVYWMNGMAGTGKTTIAYSLCEWLEENRQLGASFFCSRISSSCRNVNQVIPTITYQLAHYSPAFRSTLCKALEENMNATGKLNVVWQFKKLLEEPLLKVKGAMPEGVIVVIDALDECEDAYGVRLMLETLLKLAAGLPIKFFVTSRPEPAIADKMLSPKGYLPSVLHLHDIEESVIEEDIKKYLMESLASMSTPPSSDDIEQLTKRAGKLFIYAATAVRYILPEDIRVNSNARLKAVLVAVTPSTQSAAPSMKYKGLDELYTSILAAAFHSGRLEDEELHVMRLVLRTAICAKEPMTAQTMASLLGVTDEEVFSSLQPLRSVLHVSKAGGHVSALHASFPDFIFDRARSGIFFCNTLEPNELLAHRCFDLMKEQLRFNICNLESSCLFDRDVPDIEGRIKANISPALFYACRYWGGHLQAGGSSDDLCRKLVDFLTQKLFFWMEVLNLGHCIVTAPDILLQTQDWLANHGADIDIRAHAGDAEAFLKRFSASSCKLSTPHIYISAFPFCPRSSFVYRNYWQRTRGVLEVEGTAIAQRENAALVTWMTDSKIRAAAFSPDGAYIVSGSDDGAIRVWDARSSDLVIGPLKGHTDDVNSVSISPDGTRIISASDDHTIRVWDARSGDTISGPLAGHTHAVQSVAFSPNGTRIVSGSSDCTIRLWDAQSWGPIAGTFRGHTQSILSVSFSPDGAQVVSGSSDKTIRIWDAHTGDALGEPFQGHTDKVWSVAFSPSSIHVASGSADHTACVWDVHTGNVAYGPFHGHTDEVFSVAFTPDGTRIASGSGDFTIRVWDIPSGEALFRLFKGHSESVVSVAFSPDGTRIISSALDRTIRVWDAQPNYTVAGGFQGSKHAVTSVSFSSDDAWIVSGSSDGIITEWDAQNGDVVAKPINRHADKVWSVAISPDRTRIVSGSDDWTIRVWDVQTGEATTEPFTGHTGGVNSVVFSPSGAQIASGSDDCTIRVWDARTGEIVTRPLEGHTDGVSCIMFSPDGARIVSGSLDHTIRTWDIQAGGALVKALKGHSSEVRSVAFSTKGSLIASGSGDHTVRVWNVQTGFASVDPFKGHTDEVNSVAFSPDGTLIVSGSDDRTLRLWDAHTGNTIAGPFRGHTDVVYSVAFSANGTRIVSGSRDSESAIRVWEARTIETTRQCEGETNQAHADTISPVSTHVVPNLHNITHGVLTDAAASRNLSTTKQALIRNALAGVGDFTSHNDGWITTGDVPLIWVPPDFRDHLPFPQNTLIIGPQGSAVIDYRNLTIGE